MNILMPITAFKSREWRSEHDEFGYMDLPSLSYLGSIWERDLDGESGNRDSQNILIIYIAVIVIC
jgi:hypothetical protein